MNSNEQRIDKLHKDAPLTDIHCHPSLKSWLFKRNLWRHYCSWSFTWPWSSRCDFKMLEKGKVGVIWTSHYVPERQIVKQCCLTRIIIFLLTPIYWKLVKGSYMKRTLQMMDRFEKQINRKPDRVELAKSAEDVKRIRALGKIAAVHTIEGGHILEGNVDNLNILAERGVALLTLTHFFRNEIGSQVDISKGIDSFKFMKICGYNFHQDEPPHLTEFGYAVIERMKELSMIIDVCHLTHEARNLVFKLIKGKTPIIASHTGVAKFNPNPYSLNDNEILEIHKSKGGIGVIFMNAFLKEETKQKDGLDLIWSTMNHINKVTKSWDNVMIGSDFDGLTDPPNDVVDSSQFGNLTRYLIKKGLSDDIIKKILGGNAQRILEKGWKKN